MSKSYWCEYGYSAADITSLVQQMNSEQADFLSALGITITFGSSNVVINKANCFNITIPAFGRINVSVPDVTGTELIGKTSGSNQQYLNFIFTANSLLISANGSSLEPSGDMSQVVIITKCTDGTVCVIGSGDTTPGAHKIAIIDRYDISSAASCPQIGVTGYSTANIPQFSLATIPRGTAGKVCENAFFVLANNVAISSALATISDTDYAIARTDDFMIACR